MRAFSVIMFVVCLFAVLAGSATGQTWFTNPANGHQYAELQGFSGWLTAEDLSVALGGHLVTINDAAENAWVKATFNLRNGIGEWLWIGLHEAQPWGQNTREWVWSSGESLLYTNWGSGEPSSTAEHFVAMDGDGWWRDLSEGNWPPRHTAVVEVIPQGQPCIPELSSLLGFGGLVALGGVGLFKHRRR